MKNQVSPVAIGAAIVGVLAVLFIGFQLFGRSSNKITGIPSVGNPVPPPPVDRANYARNGGLPAGATTGPGGRPLH